MKTLEFLVAVVAPHSYAGKCDIRRLVQVGVNKPQESANAGVFPDGGVSSIMAAKLERTFLVLPGDVVE